jgi:hypothetical protein
MPDILTLERVAECRERAERATKGPWEAKCSGHDYPYIVAHGKQLACGEDFGKMPDAEFCAHARTDIPALCATVEALRDTLAAKEETQRALEEENAELKQLTIDLRACMVEARHKWGLEQDANERLRNLLREWTDMDPLRYDSEYSCCPWCNFDYSNMKHEPDCPFVLARTECGISSAPGS